ncbi:hypothetical protein OE88DRAFT_1647684 [Heliocybe sulcata]|uniref:Uncharacterized protein n=1 Tax=Heliocybe sulcata TaxID=5364 RepID=A0A5C3MQ53_9AGAM|nr:hypothetical protein OE88DRAFT_1647684 [Heliocybe sulcata]
MPMTLQQLYQLVEGYVNAYGDDAANILVSITNNGEGLHLRWVDDPVEAGATEPRARSLAPAASLLGLVFPPSEATSADPDYELPADDLGDLEFHDDDVDMTDVHPDGIINDVSNDLRHIGRRVDEDSRIVGMTAHDEVGGLSTAPHEERSHSVPPTANIPHEDRSPTPGPSRLSGRSPSWVPTEIIEYEPEEPSMDNPFYSAEHRRELEEESIHRARRQNFNMTLRGHQTRKTSS